MELMKGKKCVNENQINKD